MVFRSKSVVTFTLVVGMICKTLLYLYAAFVWHSSKNITYQKKKKKKGILTTCFQLSASSLHHQDWSKTIMIYTITSLKTWFLMLILMLATVNKCYVMHAFLSLMNTGKPRLWTRCSNGTSGSIVPLNINNMEDVSIPLFLSLFNDTEQDEKYELPLLHNRQQIVLTEGQT